MTGAWRQKCTNFRSWCWISYKTLRPVAAQQQSSRDAEAPFPARDFAQAGQSKSGYFHRANCRKAGVIIVVRIQAALRSISP